MRCAPNAHRSTLNVQRSTCERTTGSASAPPRAGFTLFELLAVLTVVSLSLVMLVGAFGSWGTAHALTGATRVLEAGIRQARATALAHSSYIIVEYGNDVTNVLKTVTYFRTFFFTNENAAAEAELAHWSVEKTALDLKDLAPAAPAQRLSGQIRLGNIPDTAAAGAAADFGSFVFRPDGTVWSWDDERAHLIAVYTRERFSREPDEAEPLVRYVRVDLATGLATVIRPGVTP